MILRQHLKITKTSEKNNKIYTPLFLPLHFNGNVFTFPWITDVIVTLHIEGRVHLSYSHFTRSYFRRYYCGYIYMDSKRYLES